MFSVHCGTGGATCSPLWTTNIRGLSYAAQAPTVAGGVIYVPYGRVGHAYLDAFPEACHSECQPLWQGQLQTGADDSAAVADGLVFVPDYDGYIYAFRVGCATGGKVWRMLTRLTSWFSWCRGCGDHIVLGVVMNGQMIRARRGG